MIMREVPAKRSTFQRNIVRRNMLRAFGHPVAKCCDMLRHVGCCSLKFETGQFFHSILSCGCCMMLWSFGRVRSTMLRLGMRTSLIFNTQHVATHRNRVAKHVAPKNVAIYCAEMLRSCGHCLLMLRPTILGYVALKCCDRLAGA